MLEPYVKGSANGYRLPTDEEWEYAARGGLSGQRFPWADTIQHSRANYYSDSSDSYDTSPTRGYHPTYNDGTVPYTSPAGSFAANGYGLHDMSGNVWEWCYSWYPGSEGSLRVICGGSWGNRALDLRVGSRRSGTPSDAPDSVGFRAVLPLAPAGMVLVPAGTFTMGWTGIATPEHQVTLSSFYLSKHETTYQLWYDVKTWADANGYTFANAGREGHDGTIGAAPSGASREPVTEVSWRDVIVWCNARSQQAGLTPAYRYSSATITNATDATACDNAVFNPSATGYRLPTEAQWEYAARYRDGVTFTPGDYLSGATANSANSAASQAVAWYDANSGSATHVVGGKTANQLGVFDMSGNVWEWCWDWYGAYGSGPDTNPTGLGSGSARVYRGGGWNNNASAGRVGYRNFTAPSDVYISIGFRAVLPPSPFAGMVVVPAGTNSGTDLDFGAYSLTNETAFYMDKYEVTKAQWDSVRTWGSSKSYTDLAAGAGKAGTHPVQTVSWYDVVKWCNARSEQAGLTPAYYTDASYTTVYRTGTVSGVDAPYVKPSADGYRLPTDEEWEYAARGGVASQRFPWGDEIQHSRANYDSSSSYSYDTSPTRGSHPTYNDGTFPYTSPAGSFAANGYGLHDMSGNVWEWCYSWYPGFEGSGRVIRGGSWGSGADGCRVADRGTDIADDAYNDLGFRAVLPPGQQ